MVDPTPAAPDQAELCDCGARLRCVNLHADPSGPVCDECGVAVSDTRAPSSSSSGAPEPPNPFAHWETGLLTERLREIADGHSQVRAPELMRACADRLDALYYGAPAPDAGTTDAPFTDADVALLRKMWHEDDCGALYALYDHDCQCENHPDVVALENLADRIEAELARLRSSLAERQGAEPPTGSKTREIL